MSKLKNHPIIPLSDFEIERAPDGLWGWFSSKELELDEYHRGQREIISDDEEFLERVLLHSNCQFFWDEVRPIAHCARIGLFSQSALIRISTQCEPYDGIVTDRLANKKMFLEATSTVEGQDRKISFLHAKRYKKSPAYQKIRYERGRNTGYIIPNAYKSEDEPIPVDADEIIKKLWSVIKNRIDKKEKKNYCDKTWLIVSFEDFLAFRSEARLARFLAEHLEAEVLGRTQFSRVILAGCEGRILIDADNEKDPKASVMVSIPERFF